MTSLIIARFLWGWSANVISLITGFYLRLIDDTMHSVSGFQVGLLTSGFFVSYLLFTMLSGPLSDIFGRKLLIAGGIVLGGVAANLYPLTSLLSLLLVIFVIEGVAASPKIPAVVAYISDATDYLPILRKHWIGIYQAAAVLALASGSVSGGLLWDSVGPKTFRLAGVVYFGTALLVFWRIRDKQHGPRNAMPKLGLPLMRSLATEPAVARTIPVWLTLSAILGAWTIQTSFQLSDRSYVAAQGLSGQSGTTIGLGFALASLAVAGGSYVWSRLSGRIAKKSILMTSIVGVYCFALTLLVLNHTLSVMPVIVLVWRYAIFFSLVLSLFLASGAVPVLLIFVSDLSDSYSSNRGVVQSFFAGVVVVGQLIGGILSGLSADFLGIDGVIILTLMLATLATFVLTFLPNIERRSHRNA